MFQIFFFFTNKRVIIVFINSSRQVIIYFYYIEKVMHSINEYNHFKGLSISFSDSDLLGIRDN